MNDASVFEDIMEALHEVEQHQKGKLKLRSNTVRLSDDEIEAEQLFFQKFEQLPVAKKYKAIEYVEELLRA